MQSNELRIGNYYYYANDVVGQLSYFDFKQAVIGDMIPQYFEALKPIPLTEEWHNNFGVEYNNSISEYVYKVERKNNFNLTIVFGGDYVWIRQSGDKPINDDIITVWNKDLTKRDMYVHEWQNLFFALTGTELKINKQ